MLTKSTVPLNTVIPNLPGNLTYIHSAELYHHSIITIFVSILILLFYSSYNNNSCDICQCGYHGNYCDCCSCCCDLLSTDKEAQAE